MNSPHIPALILRWSCFLFVLSRGLLYLIFDSPYRAFFWNEALLRPYLEKVGVDWTNYANSSDAYIQFLENAIGSFLILASLCFLTIKSNKPSKIQRTTLITAGIITNFHIILKFIGNNHELPILPEYVLQGFTPWIFLAFLKYFPSQKLDSLSPPSPELVTTLKIAIASCFIGHGLYALGWPYQPAHFVRFITATFPFISFSSASILTIIIGIIDVIIAIAMFIPRLAKPALLYIAVWGATTALARTTSHILVPLNLSAINPWLLETTVRSIHFGAPLFLYLILKKNIIPSTHPFRLGIPAPLKSKYALIPTFSIITATALAIHYHHQALVTQRQNLSLRATKIQKQLLETQIQQQREIQNNWQSQNDNLPLTTASFLQSSSGLLYSDILFSSPDLTIRFTIKPTSQNPQQTIQQTTPFYQNRKTIVSNIKNAIIKNFKQVNPDSPTFTDQQILNFVKNAQLHLADTNTIHATIHTPWSKNHPLSLDLNTQGNILPD